MISNETGANTSCEEEKAPRFAEDSKFKFRMEGIGRREIIDRLRRDENTGKESGNSSGLRNSSLRCRVEREVSYNCSGKLPLYLFVSIP